MKIDQWAGLRNDVVTERFEPPDLEKAHNVTIDDSNNIARRPGATLQLEGPAHSVWSPQDEICFFVSGGLLQQLHLDWTVTTHRSDMMDLPVSFTVCGERVYYTNGQQNGVIDEGVHRTFGLAVPPVFNASDTGGSLQPGRYLYSMSYVRADGQESGALPGTPIEVINGGISFSAIPVSDDPTVVHKILYLTNADGNLLYEAAVLENGQTSFTLADACLEVESESVYMCEAPHGHLVTEYYGHLLIANDRYLYRSQPYGPELFDLLDYLPFESRITILAPTERGLYIGTEDEIGFIAGTDPDEFVYSKLTDYGAIEGTLSNVQTHFLNFEVPENIAATFFTERGIVIGLPGGALTNITNQRYEVDASQRGASIVRQFGGSAAYITTI